MNDIRSTLRAVHVEAQNRSRRVWHLVTGRPTVQPLTVIAWLAFVALLLLRTVDIATFDYRDHDLAGDQASFLVQAQSLAHEGHDLTFDRGDFDRYAQLGWTAAPYGLFFQRYQDGWAFAKPYAYSAVAAPSLVILGDVRGMAATNALLVVALVVVSVAVLRTRYTGPVVPLVAASFYLLAQPYFYGYVLHAELLLALLTIAVFGLVIWYWRSGRWVWMALAFAVMGIAVSEKPPMLVLFLPVAALLVADQRAWRSRFALVAVGLCAWGLAVGPYLKYSEGATWNPYSGTRYYARAAVPFDGASTHERGAWRLANREEHFRIDVVERAFRAPGERLQALMHYVVGRHTGLLVFLPTGLFLMIAALSRARSLDRRAWAVVAGILGYILFYVLFFPRSYTGGVSLGNRYFLQIAPSIVAATTLAKVSTRAAASAAIAGGFLSIALLWPHHVHPSSAYSEQLNQTTPIQRLLPFESNLRVRGYFECPVPYTAECITTASRR